MGGSLTDKQLDELEQLFISADLTNVCYLFCLAFRNLWLSSPLSFATFRCFFVIFFVGSNALEGWGTGVYISSSERGHLCRVLLLIGVEGVSRCWRIIWRNLLGRIYFTRWRFDGQAYLLQRSKYEAQRWPIIEKPPHQPIRLHWQG